MPPLHVAMAWTARLGRKTEAGLTPRRKGLAMNSSEGYELHLGDSIAVLSTMQEVFG